MKHPDPQKLAADVGEDAHRLVALLEDATAIQWERSRKVAEVEDAGITSKGTLSRPTEDTALDPVRLALRSEVQRSTRSLLRAWAELSASHRALLAAMEAWKGDPPGST